MMQRLRSGDPEGSADHGFTLVEVMVGMVILSIFLAIFGGAMISMFHSVYRTQQTSYAQSNANIVFGKLERQVRYADGISIPGTNPTNGDVLVEFTNSSGGPQVCTELRLTTDGVLMQRSWVQPPQSTSPISMGATAILGRDMSPETPSATGDSTASIAGPFARYAATGASNNQRLEVALSTQEASQVANVQTRVRHIDVTFAALNTGTSTSSDSSCGVGRRSPW